MTTAAQTRLAYLDGARASALILGIIFHASLSFVPVFIGWAVMDIATSQSVLAFVVVSHSFRMALFFMIAGYFSHMMLGKRGTSAFLQNRFSRLAVPFCIGWFILKPLLVACWVAGAQSMRGDVDIMTALMQGLESLKALPVDIFVGSHLWFLYYLMVITVLMLVVNKVLAYFPALSAWLLRQGNSITSAMSQSGLGILLLSIPTAACLWFMQAWGMDTPDKSLTPVLPVLAIYGGAFLFGWMLQKQPEFLARFAAISAVKVVLGVASVIAVILLYPYETQHQLAHYHTLKASFVMSYSVMMWSLVSLSLGVCKRIFQQERPLVRYLSDASYWLYLIHLPIVIGLQIAVAELPFHWTLKWLAVVALTMGVSVLMYDAFVRSTFIGKTLNGQRKARAIFTLAKPRLSVA